MTKTRARPKRMTEDERYTKLAQKGHWVLGYRLSDPSFDDPGDKPLPHDIVLDVDRDQFLAEWEDRPNETTESLYISEDVFKWMVAAYKRRPRVRDGKVLPRRPVRTDKTVKAR